MDLSFTPRGSYLILEQTNQQQQFEVLVHHMTILMRMKRLKLRHVNQAQWVSMVQSPMIHLIMINSSNVLTPQPTATDWSKKYPQIQKRHQTPSSKRYTILHDMERALKLGR